MRSLGDAHRFGGDYAKGVEAYRASHKLDPEEIVRVFEAECLLRQDLVPDALALIRAIKLDAMSGAEAADHARLASVMPANGYEINFVFTGKVEGDKWSGDVHLGEYGPATFTATKA